MSGKVRSSDDPPPDPEVWENRPMRSARALVVLDEQGSLGMSAEDEYDELLLDWRELHDIELDAALAHRFGANERRADGCDAVTFDWGGMSFGQRPAAAAGRTDQMTQNERDAEIGCSPAVEAAPVPDRPATEN